MPLRYLHRFRGGCMAVWEICEEDSFFEERLVLSPEEKEEWLTIGFGKRKTHWLAARHVLQLLDGSQPRRSLLRAPSGRPLFVDGKGFCSLSHSGRYAAAATASMPVGIDIQKLEERILRLSAKFMTEQERQRWEGHPQQQEIFTLYWAAKEALFKAAALQKVNFKQQLRIHLPDFREEGRLFAEIYRPREEGTASETSYALHSGWELRYRLLKNYIYSIAIKS